MRNHDVVFLSLLDTEPFVRAAGLTFVPCCEKEFPAGFLNERSRQLAKLTGEACVRSTVKGIAAGTEAMLNSLPATFAAAGVDAVVLEALAQGVPQVAIPITHDQPGVAARIAAKKTGVVLPMES